MFHCIGKPCKQQYAHIKQDCTLIKEEILPKYTGDITVLHIPKANGAPFSAFYVCFQAKTLQLNEMLLRRMMITIVFAFGYPHLQPASTLPLLQTGNGNSRQMETFLLSYE